MTGLKIPYLKEMYRENPAIISDRLMASGKMIKIDKINWNDYPHLIDTVVYLGYCDHRLWLHYRLQNELVRAVCRTDQDPVWQDSCVEFFLRQGEMYRNFEFNSLGVCLSAYGPDRNTRKSLEQDSLAQILRYPSLNIESLPSEITPVNWSLTVGIPLGLIGLEAGGRFFANFYKCGDKTKVPHYISWSEIATPSPDFHQPRFFGPVELVR